MLLSFHDNFIARTLGQFVKSFDSAAILDREGNIFALHYETLADLGTLGTAASTVLKYFPMSKKDVVIVNDPYSGGTVLSTLSLVTALNENLFLIARKGFRPRLILAQKLDEEGLRIPPTPLVQNGQINVPILEAMSEHPQAPEFFKERTEEFCQLVLRKAHEFEVLTEREGAFFKLPRLLKHIEATKQRVLEIIAEPPAWRSRSRDRTSFRRISPSSFGVAQRRSKGRFFGHEIFEDSLFDRLRYFWRCLRGVDR